MIIRRMCGFVFSKLLTVNWVPIGLEYLVIEKIHPTDYIAPRHDPDLEIWVPRIPASLETGAKGGTGYIFSSSASMLISQWALQNLRRVV